MTAKLRDYSGPLKENLELKDLSKEFLVKLAKEWQGTCVRQAEMSVNLVREKLGEQAAQDFELELWTRAAKINVPRIAKLANIQVRDAVDYTKVSQLLIEGLFLQPVTSIKVISREHVIFNVHRCVVLEHFEKLDPSKIEWVCQRLEVALFTRYLQVVLPDYKVNALKLPPRKSPTEMACSWEYVRAR